MKLWKKVLSAATAGVLCLGSVGVTGMQSVLESVGTVLSASAEAYTIEIPVGTGTTLLSYTINEDDTIVINDCGEDASGNLEIPEKIGGKTVTSIGNQAFNNCAELTNVVIPNSVINIGENSFFLLL